MNGGLVERGSAALQRTKGNGSVGVCEDLEASSQADGVSLLISLTCCIPGRMKRRWGRALG